MHRTVIKLVPPNEPGTRMVWVTDPNVLSSEAGWDTRPFAQLMYKLAARTGKPNGLHFVLAIPDLLAADLLSRFEYAIDSYMQVGQSSRGYVDTRNLVYRLARAQQTSPGVYNVVSGRDRTCNGNGSDTEVRVSLISPEYIALHQSTKLDVLHRDVWEILLAARNRGPADGRPPWPITGPDIDAALASWAKEPPSWSNIVSVTWISRQGDNLRPSAIRNYINADVAERLQEASKRVS